MKPFNLILTLTLAMGIILSGCKTNDRQKNDNMQFEQGTFGYDAEFMQQHQSTILLQKGDAKILIAPGYQGRVLTSTARGDEGKSFGWLNYKLIEQGEPVEHFNNYGGEERLWLGPEGGQYSIFFPPGVPFAFENWQVPAPIDVDSFDLVSANDTVAKFVKTTELTNYSGYRFVVKINRTVRLLNEAEFEEKAGFALPDGLPFVAYETVNKLTNAGKLAWSQETGLLSIWVLGQLISSPTNVVLAPYVTGEEAKLGPIVNDSYFGKVPAERLVVKDGLILFKADGLQRGKIGLSPMRAKNFLGSFDYGENVLTLVFFNKPDEYIGYVNSMWELQEKPYAGDAINSYNDGPLEDGSQLGPFYELETSSPAAQLAAGESLAHTSLTIHLTGEPTLLEPLIQQLFNISIEEIRNAFGK